jgi:hypothetical protein
VLPNSSLSVAAWSAKETKIMFMVVKNCPSFLFCMSKMSVSHCCHYWSAALLPCRAAAHRLSGIGGCSGGMSGSPFLPGPAGFPVIRKIKGYSAGQERGDRRRPCELVRPSDAAERTASTINRVYLVLFGIPKDIWSPFGSHA